ncbi:MAG: transposase, partial [Candidatus Saccharibacteria bacterium]
ENKSMENRIITLQQEYDHLRRKYIKAYNDMLDAKHNSSVNLLKPEIIDIITNTFKYWEGKRLHNYAFTIMSNHIHWVFEVLEKNENGQLIYLEDILQSVKRYSANRINKVENRQGNLWQKESFDTTIRSYEHMAKAINYTLNNPVNAGLISNWKQWPGSYWSDDCL